MRWYMGECSAGGERSAHTIFDYSIPATAFPSGLHYVALGHLHRTQELAAACPVHYCGSPLQLDFGEALDAKSVKVIEARAGHPARVEGGSAERRTQAVDATGFSRGRCASHTRSTATTICASSSMSGRATASPTRCGSCRPNVVDVRIADRTNGDSDKPNGPPSGIRKRIPIKLCSTSICRSRKEGDTEPLKALFKELLEA